MNGIVVRNIRRADAAVVAQLGHLGVATVREADERTGLMQPYVRPQWRGARIAGSRGFAVQYWAQFETL